MGKKILFLLFCCVSTLHGYAQIIGGDDKPVQKPKGKSESSKKAPPKVVQVSLMLAIQGDHSFYLKVNDKEYGRVSKNEVKTVKLVPALYKLSFEEADSTGETIERYIDVTKEMTKQRDSTYSVNFKRDYPEIIRSYPVGLQNGNKQQ